MSGATRTPQEYRYLFGPVPSRRFGRSLGVDLVPHKTCSLNCVFCQVGRTRQTVLERRDYVPVKDVLDELTRWAASGEHADVITLSGSGEPTLHLHFGDILRAANALKQAPTLLLSNGTCFTTDAVRRDATAADTVKLSLHAWDQTSYETIVRPHPTLRFQEIYAGYLDFRAMYTGRLVLEVFLVRGMNDHPAAIENIAQLCRNIQPEAIHLNTAARPPAEPQTQPLQHDQLIRLAKLFTPQADVVAAFHPRDITHGGVTGERVLAVLRRRPCTAAQLTASLGAEEAEVQRVLDTLLRKGWISTAQRLDEIYFTSLQSEPDDRSSHPHQK